MTTEVDSYGYPRSFSRFHAINRRTEGCAEKDESLLLQIGRPTVERVSLTLLCVSPRTLVSLVLSLVLTCAAVRFL